MDAVLSSVEHRLLVPPQDEFVHCADLCGQRACSPLSDHSTSQRTKCPLGAQAESLCSAILNRRSGDRRSLINLKRLVIDRDGAVNERIVLRGEVEELEHRRTDHPLIADQRLNDVGIGIARARN